MAVTTYLPWDATACIGVEEIDLEHRTFVALINRLDSVKDDPQLAPRVLQELVKYVAFHFQSEENIFFEAGYPELAAHRALHLALLEKLNVVLMELRSGEIDFHALPAFFRRWYLQHTSVEDRRFKEFLTNTAGQATRQALHVSEAGNAPAVAVANPSLAHVPSAWLDDMLSASVRLRLDEVNALAEAIRAAYPEVAAWASSLAADFDYPLLAATVRSALEERNGRHP